MSEVPPIDDTAVLWSATAPERRGRPLLLMLHGYGSNEADLFGLVPYLPPEYAVASLRAPLAAPPSPGFSWYPFDTVRSPREEGATAAARRVIEWLDAAAADAPAVGLLGFSQGVSVAIQALRLQPERFAFTVNLSGTFAGGSMPGDAVLAARRPPAFWGRGDRDQVIPMEMVIATAEWLPRHTSSTATVYPGLTHSVSQQELDDVRAFLADRLAAD